MPMGALLTADARISCAHGGVVQVVPSSLRVRVNGVPVLTLPAVGVIAGCRLPSATAPGPCVSASWVAGALRVRASGRPVLLSTCPAICQPTGTPVVVAKAQTRVQGS